MAKRQRNIQYAALPIVERDGQTEVLLVTSRETRRWIIPKGWPEKKLKPHEVAAREALEEAGVEGRVHAKPLATYGYGKRLRSGKTIPCEVETFLLEVTREHDDWSERRQRERRWLPPAEAALLVSDAGLVEILLRLAQPAAEE